MDYSKWAKERFKQMHPGANGRLQADWQLTDTALIDAVKLRLPPAHTIPIIFVPGIMGSNLCNSQNKPVWLLNGVKGVPVKLATAWARKNAGERQAILHPGRTKVYAGGAVPNRKSSGGHTEQHYRKRGWGEVSEASYHQFLLWLDEKMNAESNPANWTDFSNSTLREPTTVLEKSSNRLPTGLIMKMRGLPDVAEAGYSVDPITSDDLLKRCRSNFPIYAFGYNWLASNQDAAKHLKKRIESVISENNIGEIECTQVILVTHSMGGLVARACSQLPLMSEKIAGVVHGVMPATGAAVAYRRCKVGMRDEDFVAGLVIGSDGKEVTAVFAQSPGALQLLPSESYGPSWLEIADSTGNTIASLPVADPYKEIYLERNRWWGLINEEWLKPEGGTPISWNIFSMNIAIAREFHRNLAGKYHKKSYVFYGGGASKESFLKIRWSVKREKLLMGSAAGPPLTAILATNHRDIKSDGSNNLYIGGKQTTRTTAHANAPVAFAIAAETSHWEVRCGGHDSSGDGTVPTNSGGNPRKSGGSSILQQFSLNGIQHEPAYKSYPVAQQVVHYAITKLAALANQK